MPPVSIPPMERPKEASIHVAQYLEDFGEIIRGFLEVRENSWRICGSARREERERLGYEYGASTKTLSQCTHICTAVSSLLSTACSTIYWINVDSSRVHCNTAVLSRRWIIALQSTTAAFSSLARFTVLRKVVIGLLQSIQVHWCSAMQCYSSVHWYSALDKSCSLVQCTVLSRVVISQVHFLSCWLVAAKEVWSECQGCNPMGSSVHAYCTVHQVVREKTGENEARHILQSSLLFIHSYNCLTIQMQTECKLNWIMHSV